MKNSRGILNGDGFEFGHEGLLSHAVPLARPPAIVHVRGVPNGGIQEDIFGGVRPLMPNLLLFRHSSHQSRVDKPLDLALVVVNGVGMETIRAVVVKLYPELVPARRTVHVKIRLHNALVVPKKLKVDFVLHRTPFAGGDVEAREQAARVAVRALDSGTEFPRGISV